MKVQEKILTDVKMPFCPGCGHTVNTKSISKALQSLGYGPKDVTIVSDIGCSGLIDPLFATHTIHGLHGRAPALGVGVSLGLEDPNKKVIIVQGDGGVTIGLQHILEAARRNINVTLVIYNNLVYGMTGGQMSGLSTHTFKDLKSSSDDADPYDIINLAHQAGAAFSLRINDIKKYPEALAEAIEVDGFSIVELSSLCTSYGMKKLAEFKHFITPEEKLTAQRPVGICEHQTTTSLFNQVKDLTPKFNAKLNEPIGIVIAGSAGGGIQSAAKILAQAAILSGLSATMKGEYPITVGTGFSAAEVILSKDPIHYTGLERPDVLLVVTEDGWRKVKNRITDNSKIILDEAISNETPYEKHSFLKQAGKRGAAFSAVSYWVKNSGIIPMEALLKAVEDHKHKDTLIETILYADKL